MLDTTIAINIRWKKGFKILKWVVLREQENILYLNAFLGCIVQFRKGDIWILADYILNKAEKFMI
jgi:hypothetical protein